MSFLNELSETTMREGGMKGIVEEEEGSHTIDVFLPSRTCPVCVCVRRRNSPLHQVSLSSVQAQRFSDSFYPSSCAPEPIQKHQWRIWLTPSRELRSRALLSIWPVEQFLQSFYMEFKFGFRNCSKITRLNEAEEYFCNFHKEQKKSEDWNRQLCHPDVEDKPFDLDNTFQHRFGTGCEFYSRNLPKMSFRRFRISIFHSKFPMTAQEPRWARRPRPTVRLLSSVFATPLPH